MTRLESGAVAPNVALHDLGEIVGSALRRAGKILAHHQVELDLAPDLPMLELDAVLFEQVLFNLLDNAAKYAPPDTTIRIQSWRERRLGLRCRCSTKASGIPPADLERIFDKFYRAQKGRPGPRRHRARARDLPRLRRGHARHHRRRQPHRPQRRGLHHQPADPARTARKLDTAA